MDSETGAAQTASAARRTTIDALLLAGRRPGIDALAERRGVTIKALIPVAGRAMVERVATTLLACPGLAKITLLTQDAAAIAAALPADPRFGVLVSGDGIAGSIAAAIERGEVALPLFVTTADHALLTSATVAAFLAGVPADADVAVGVVERAVVEARFPTTRRTWLRFSHGEWTGANLFYLGNRNALAVLGAWAEIERHRKKGWRLVARFGPLLLARFLTRTITLDAAVRAAGRRLGAAVRAVPLADPLAAIDVDKPADLLLAEAVLEGRA